MLGRKRQQTDQTPQAADAQQLYDTKYPLVSVPFHGVWILVKLRELTQAQIAACGDFSLIETMGDKEELQKRKGSVDDVMEFGKLQAEIVQRSMVSPSYQQLMEILESDEQVKRTRAELLELEQQVHTMEPSAGRKELQERIDALFVWTDLLMPEDFAGAIMSYALGVNKSDIKEVTAAMLLDAAMLAEKGHDNPADHIRGNFNDFNREDINRRAWLELIDYRKKNPPKTRKR